MVGVPKANVEPFVPRVTLTLPALASCREMLFEVAGAGKRAILTRVLGRREPAGEPRAFHRRDDLAGGSGGAAGEFSWRDATNPCALVVMGVSGSGKSTIAERLAERLGWRYEDGDRFHPASQCREDERGPSPHR